MPTKKKIYKFVDMIDDETSDNKYRITFICDSNDFENVCEQVEGYSDIIKREIAREVQ